MKHDTEAAASQWAAEMEAAHSGERIAAFRAVIAPAPEKFRARYERDFIRLQFKDDADFAAYLEEIRPDIEAIAKNAASASR